MSNPKIYFLMAKKAKKNETSKGLRLEIVNPNAAGIDVSVKEMQVCVPQDRDGENNRKFGCFTEDLRTICEYLKACMIDTVAMEATGVYWRPLFMMLADSGIDVILVNPRDVKSYSEKKTDELDAEWLMLLHSYGLLKASFQPANLARMIRSLTRRRDKYVKWSSVAVQHMQKAMEQMNIKLTNVISDITGTTGMRIIYAILAGERDPKKLSMLADPRCKSDRETFAASLEGTWDEDHLFDLSQSVKDYEYSQAQLRVCDKKIEEVVKQYTAEVQVNKELVRTKKRVCKKNIINFDVEKYAQSIWGINAMAIPGMSRGALLVLMGELGHDFVQKFPTVQAFCRWLNLVPNNKESGGKIFSSHVPKRKNFAGQDFRQCANTLCNSKNTLGYYFRRQRAKGGHKYAIVCTAHKLAKIFYSMVANQREFDDKMSALDEKLLLERKILQTQKALHRLHRKLRESA